MFSMVVLLLLLNCSVCSGALIKVLGKNINTSNDDNFNVGQYVSSCVNQNATWVVLPSWLNASSTASFVLKIPDDPLVDWKACTCIGAGGPWTFCDYYVVLEPPRFGQELANFFLWSEVGGPQLGCSYTSTENPMTFEIGPTPPLHDCPRPDQRGKITVH